MFVTVNTVRTHVRSILRKLGVPRRNEAVRRGWELDLIPSHTDTSSPRGFTLTQTSSTRPRRT